MSVPALGLRQLTLAGLFDLVRNVITKMTGNPKFTTPNPTLVVLGDALDDAEAKHAAYIAAQTDAEQKLTLRNDAAEVLRGLMSEEALYVQYTTDDAADIESAGMPVRSTPEPQIMTQVQHLRVEPSPQEGELRASWQPVEGARFYRTQICTEAEPVNWKDKTTSTAAKCSLNDTLVSGQRVYVRVCAVGGGKDNVGAWSDIARKTVP